MNNFTGNVSKFTDYILKIDRCYGSFLGLAIGDAMGASLEFSQPGTFQPITYYQSGGPFNLPSGYWTDDTSMAICIAESLAHHKSLNLEDQMQRFVNWYRYGYASSTGTCFDIGNGCMFGFNGLYSCCLKSSFLLSICSLLSGEKSLVSSENDFIL